MGQSNAIFGALLIAFIVFVTVRGELPTYLDILRGGGTENTDNSSIPSSLNSLSQNSSDGTPIDIIGGANTAVPPLPATPNLSSLIEPN